MIEVVGNLWQFPGADVRVITTNGDFDKKGYAIMGRGSAYEAARQFHDLPRMLGAKLKERGNRVFVFTNANWGMDFTLVTFPTKNEWHENSDIDLIFRSACKLADLADAKDWKKIVAPRFGCGAGRLNWERQVKPMVEKILDDRFHIITYG